jgi:hypothetical protein
MKTTVSELVNRALRELGVPHPRNNSDTHRGYDFERRINEKIMERFANWSSITFYDGKGNVLSSSDDFRKGPDGGVDLNMIIEAKTEAAEKQLHTKAKQIIEEEL